jgi:hypothetical protein
MGPGSKKIGRQSGKVTHGMTAGIFAHLSYGMVIVAPLCPSAASSTHETMLALDGPRWTAPTKPGRYSAYVFISWPSKPRRIEETGEVGVVVSRTQPLRVLPRPICR